MGKNNKFINQMLEVARRNRENIADQESKQIVPSVYAAIAIALHREYGFGAERIKRVFSTSQDVWYGLEGKRKAMLDLCKKETGITLYGDEKFVDEE